MAECLLTTERDQRQTKADLVNQWALSGLQECRGKVIYWGRDDSKTADPPRAQTSMGDRSPKQDPWNSLYNLQAIQQGREFSSRQLCCSLCLSGSLCGLCLFQMLVLSLPILGRSADLRVFQEAPQVFFFLSYCLVGLWLFQVAQLVWKSLSLVFAAHKC